ncbi:hypothetical protein DAPPUDRAFT_321500 [Daphnia pulex]|uniref:Uncharacterized protein n=1 Tax=Daphnia pulex TaxID=6669 RepID=E9GTD2_DAPPU|nr:hypothetical protein DAPPUDRAFT_321500 [Daphnia pulex]|eukprot:EFX77380.1 hypothetical protein DAPPUDRAFT_321500 [Daphnia pulex]
MSPFNIYEEQDSHLNRMNIIVEQLNGVLTGQNVLNHFDNLDQIVIALHIERDHLNIEEKFSEIAGPVQNVMPEQDLNLIPQAELVINQYNESDEDTASEKTASAWIQATTPDWKIQHREAKKRVRGLPKICKNRDEQYVETDAKKPRIAEGSRSSCARGKAKIYCSKNASSAN